MEKPVSTKAEDIRDEKVRHGAKLLYSNLMCETKHIVCIIYFLIIILII